MFPCEYTSLAKHDKIILFVKSVFLYGNDKIIEGTSCWIKLKETLMKENFYTPINDTEYGFQVKTKKFAKKLRNVYVYKQMLGSFTF